MSRGSGAIALAAGAGSAGGATDAGAHPPSTAASARAAKRVDRTNDVVVIVTVSCFGR